MMKEIGGDKKGIRGYSVNVKEVYNSIKEGIKKKVYPWIVAAGVGIPVAMGYGPHMNKVNNYTTPKAYGGMTIKMEEKENLPQRYAPYSLVYIIDKDENAREAYFLLMNYNNLLRAMYASVVQGNYGEHRIDQRGEYTYHLFGKFIHFPVKIDGEEYIAHAWLYTSKLGSDKKYLFPFDWRWKWSEKYYGKTNHPPQNKEGHVPIPVFYRIFLTKKGDATPDKGISVINNDIFYAPTFDANNPIDSADVFSPMLELLKKKRKSNREADREAQIAVAREIPKVIEEIVEDTLNERGVRIRFSIYDKKDVIYLETYLGRSLTGWIEER